jgi:hypothetical protein
MLIADNPLDIDLLCKNLVENFSLLSLLCGATTMDNSGLEFA